VSSWLAITFLLRYLTRHSFGVFALYRLVLGGAVLALIGAGLRSPAGGPPPATAVSTASAPAGHSDR
jgi:undecaprenyl-diphosphatase